MKVKTIALASSALVAVATLAAPASAGSYMGKVNLGVGHYWEDYSDGGESSGDWENNFTAIHGAASVNVPYNDRVNLQFDVFGAASALLRWIMKAAKAATRTMAAPGLAHI